MSDLFAGQTETAKEARDKALARVKENGGSWRDQMLQALPLLSGFEGTAEDIRIRLRMKDLPAPHHHNAWGELIKAALKHGKILPTGKLRQMKGTKSHARRTPVYVVK